MLDPDHHGILGLVSDAAHDVRLALELANRPQSYAVARGLDLLGRIADRDWPDFSAVVDGMS